MSTQPATHPPLDQLRGLAAGTLDTETSTSVQHHLRRCAACTAFAASERRAQEASTERAGAVTQQLDAVGGHPTSKIELTPVADQPITALPLPIPGPRAGSRRHLVRIAAGLVAVLIVLILVATAVYVDHADAAAVAALLLHVEQERPAPDEGNGPLDFMRGERDESLEAH